jgi:hypothetical protein
MTDVQALRVLQHALDRAGGEQVILIVTARSRELTTLSLRSLDTNFATSTAIMSREKSRRAIPARSYTAA